MTAVNVCYIIDSISARM